MAYLRNERHGLSNSLWQLKSLYHKFTRAILSHQKDCVRIGCDGNCPINFFEFDSPNGLAIPVINKEHVSTIYVFWEIIMALPPIKGNTIMSIACYVNKAIGVVWEKFDRTALCLYKLWQNISLSTN